MSEWWTYRPADLLMFAPETYYRLFELYNADVWPAQIIVLSAAFTIFLLMLRGPRWRGHAVAALLAAAWLVVAWAYFLETLHQHQSGGAVLRLGFLRSGRPDPLVGLSTLILAAYRSLSGFAAA
jgi:Family of unknown function (DUF6064)